MYLVAVHYAGVETPGLLHLKAPTAILMATAAWRAVIERTVELHVVELLRQLEHARDADRVEVLASWGRAKLASFALRPSNLIFLDKMPHRLCGLAHPDPGVAAQTAEDCLRQFDLLPCDDLRHRLSTLFLSPSGPFRIAMEQISTRPNTLDHFPDLTRATLRFHICGCC